MRVEDRIAPRIQEEDAVRLARDLYGLEVLANALPGEHDNNFHLTARTGQSFVMKAMHPAREHGFIDLQVRALEHVAERAPRLALPRVVPNCNGKSFSQIGAPDGSSRFIWLLTFIHGNVLAQVRPHSLELLYNVGRFLGELDTALQDFLHPDAHRELKWSLEHASWIREYLHHIQHESRRALVTKVLDIYERQVLPILPSFRRSVIYGDANDYNVLIGDAEHRPREVVGVIDFGDVHHGITVAELAVAVAYAILSKSDPLAAAAVIVSGYHQSFPLQERELSVLHSLIGMRLAVSVTNSAYRKTLKPDDSYVTIHEELAWETLDRWSRIHPRFAHYMFRSACGLPAFPNSHGVSNFLRTKADSAAPIVGIDLRTEPSLVLDLSVGSALLGADPSASELASMTETIFREMKRAGVSVGVGRYDEPRRFYKSQLFGDNTNPLEERRTIHLGIDLFVEPGTPVQAPLDGRVHTVTNNVAPFDYGPLVILRHEEGEGRAFFSLYGHLSTATLTKLKLGQRVRRGQEFAHIGEPHENGGWPPHLHFQIILDLLELDADFPGVAAASQRAVWTALSPDPNILLGIPTTPSADENDFAKTLTARATLFGSNLSLSYWRPLKIVSGWMEYLYSDTAQAYLDFYNNVPLIGHSHPRVVRAAQQQLALLNTNTRYLHENAIRYAERLTELLPEPLRVCFFVNSGSEANELALRMARARTGKEDVVVLEHAYHGNTNTLIDISPYKFNGPGGRGQRPWVHVAPLPDDYRGIYRREDVESGSKYAKHIADILDSMKAEGRGACAFIAETVPSVAGQIVFPPAYLSAAYRHARAEGVVCIADEVQVGFGRLGTHFWGFETQGVAPDIVVLGKPIGNGFPLAAVITTREIAESFANGMEFFSTFGGNPVACAAGLAVLDVLRDERLQENALRVGNYLLDGLKHLQTRHSLIGDIRGSGLFLGLDLVRDPESREPASKQADYLVNRLRDCGILTGTDGPHHNVIKLRPPLILGQASADLFLSTLAAILQEDAAQPRC